MTLRCTYEGCMATAKARYADGFALMQDCSGFKTGWYGRAHVDAIIDAGANAQEIDWSEWSHSPVMLYALFRDASKSARRTRRARRL
jgi:hypothetical protein